MPNFSIKRVQCKLACKLPSVRKVSEANVRKVSEANALTFLCSSFRSSNYSTPSDDSDVEPSCKTNLPQPVEKLVCDSTLLILNLLIKLKQKSAKLIRLSSDDSDDSDDSDPSDYSTPSDDSDDSDDSDNPATSDPSDDSVRRDL